MHKIIFIVIALMSPFFLKAQENGIQFEHGSWSEVLAKANKENKPIYIDFFTTWCGPCKLMASQYFTKEEAHKKYNNNFICYKLDAEKGEGLTLAQQYHVNGYPTNLFVNPKNQQVFYVSMGCPRNLAEFLQNADNALEEYNDKVLYNDYLARFNSGKYDDKFLLLFMDKNKRLRKDNDAYVDVYFSKYGKNGKNITAQKAFDIASKYEASAHTQIFDFIIMNQSKLSANTELLENYISNACYTYLQKSLESHNPEDIQKAIKKTEANIKYADLIIFPTMQQYYQSSSDSIQLKSLYEQYGAKFDELSAAEISEMNNYYLDKVKNQIKMQLEVSQVPQEKMNEMIEKNLSANKSLSVQAQLQIANYLNSISWDIYERYNIHNALMDKAISWILHAIELSESDPSSKAMEMDTYAHLLEHNGAISQAIDVEQKALQIAKELNEDTTDYESYLDNLTQKNNK